MSKFVPKTDIALVDNKGNGLNRTTRTVDIRLIGFSHPPGTLEMYREIFGGHNIKLFLIDPLQAKNIPYHEIRNSYKELTFVILQTGEGHSHLEFDLIIDRLLGECGMPADRVVLYSGCLFDENCPIYRIGFVSGHLVNTLNTYNRPIESFFKFSNPTHHYVCLNRYERWQRYQLVEKLFEMGLEKYGKISYAPGLKISVVNGKKMLASNFITPDRVFRYPLVLDRSDVSYKDGFAVDFPELTNAAVNVITESSYEKLNPADPEIDRPGLTEKTFKAILLGQFPIFLAPYKTVQCFRQWGFDAFDDIIDHSYDLERDPIKRIEMVAKQVEKICLIPLENLARIKQTHYLRLQKNIERLNYLAYENGYEFALWRAFAAKHGIVQ